MSAIIGIIVGLIAGLLVGGGVAFFARKRADGTSLQQAEEQASRILAEAESKQKLLLLEAKEETLKERQTLENELRERRAEVARVEQRLTQKEENLDRKADQIEKREQSLRDREASVDLADGHVEVRLFAAVGRDQAAHRDAPQLRRKLHPGHVREADAELHGQRGHQLVVRQQPHVERSSRAATHELGAGAHPQTGEVFFVDDISMSPTDAVHVWNPETLKAKLLPYEPNIFGGQRVVFQSPVD